MPYVCAIRFKIMNKAEKFDESLQKLSKFAKVLSHPARLAILKYLAETRTCISGDISDYLPLGRTTVSQHLKELRDLDLIRGEIDGLRISYCLNSSEISHFRELFENYFNEISVTDFDCEPKSYGSGKKDE
jgi:ArsR family transcriptional regulator, arsenate/arsenite/antimonite-responsive transcriptional repressor